MSFWKPSIIIVLLLSVAAPLSQVHAQKFTPNVNLNSGNTYGGTTGGVSISGVGGAIASCTNVGSFLVNTASDFLSSKLFGGSAKSAYSFISGDGDAVEVSDKKAQDKLKSIDTTNKCLDGVAYAIAKNTLAQVTDKTLNWVNTGLNGNPLYVQNMDSYLRTIANQQIRSFLQTTQGSDPIFGNALESTIRTSITGQSDGLLNVQLDTPQAHAYNSFLSDFTNGGWSSFLNPSNNPIGALFTATDNLSQNINSSQENAKAEVQRNNGFLDMKHCVQFAPIDTSTTSKAIANGLSADPTCLQWVTDTPGSIIANQVGAITTSPIRQLEYADKINEVLGGFFDSFVNSLLSKGLRGSGSGSSIDFGFSSQGDNIVLDANGNALDSSLSSSLGYQSTTGGNALGQNFDISRPQQFRAILKTQYDYRDRAQDSQAALARVVPALGALDYCIPGPNPNWSGASSSNFSSLVGSLQQASKENPSTIERVASAIPVIGGFIHSLFGSDEPPQIFSTPGILTDGATGLSVQVPRTFFVPDDNSDFDGGMPRLIKSLTTAYNTVASQYQYYDGNAEINKVFIQAGLATNDPSYAAGFNREAYNETLSILNYNKTASQIDDQYNTNIGQTQSNIDQMELIRKQVNAIVATAKADYIKKRAAAGNPVDMQCLNNAYDIDNSAINGIGRQEPDPANDPIVQHSADAAKYFYTQIIK